MHCFSEPGCSKPGLERGWYFSFAGNVTYPKAAELRDAAAASRRPAARRDRQPLPRAATGPRPHERAGARRPHRRRPRGRARRGHRRARRRIDANATAAFPSRERPAEEGARPALPRRREHPRRDRPPRRARRPTTSCSRSGRGSACSPATWPTASATSTRSSSTARSSRTSPSSPATGRRLHWGDALALDLAALDPPRKLVANLPYNVATPLVAESLTGLPSVEHWCVMVQREVADRFFAEPSTKAYGAVSVLVQLAARRTGFHPVARTVFRPPPNVDSALVAFGASRSRTGSTDQAVVEAAFAHRRKTLPNSVALAGLAPRERAAAALEARSAAPPGEASRPSSRPRGASSSPSPRAPGARRRAAAPNQPRARRRAAAGGREARGRDRPPAGRPRRPRAIADAPALSVTGFEGDTLVRDALAALAAAAGVEPRWRRSRSGSPSQPASAAAAPTRRPRSGSPTRRCRGRSRPPSCTRSRRPRRRRPVLPRRRPPARPGDGAALEPLDLPQDYWIVLALPHGVTKPSTAPRSTAASTSATAPPAGRSAGPRSSSARRRPPAARLSRCRRTTSPPRRSPRSCSGSARSEPTSAAPARPSTASSTTAATPMGRRALRAAAHLAHRARLVRVSDPPLRSWSWTVRRSSSTGRRASAARCASRLASRSSSPSSRASSSSSARSTGGRPARRRRGRALRLWGRAAPRQEVREGSWILAVSQLAVVLVPALALVLTAFAVVALVILAVVALVLLLRDRRGMSARALGRGQVVRQRVLVP